MTADTTFEQKIRVELRERLLRVSARDHDSMSYFRRRWDESRGDRHVRIGAVACTTLRLLQTVQRRARWSYTATERYCGYHADHIEDEFGFLTDQPIEHSGVLRGLHIAK